MASRDIVNQMTDEMGMNQQMLQNMQQQQMTQMAGPHQGGGYPPQQVDFGQMSPEQQMQMMQPMQPQIQMPPQMQQHHLPPVGPGQIPQMAQSDDDTVSTSSSDSSASAEMDLDKLGLGVAANRSYFDTFLHYLKDPIVIIVIFVLLNLPQVDAFLKPLLPFGLAYSNLYYIAIKAAIAGLLYFSMKLVI